VLLLGVAARGRLRGLSVTTGYQREVLADRSGLASERGSVDLSLTAATGRLTGSFDYDFAMGAPGKGHLTWSSPFGGGRWLASVTALRYVPYFSLSTIWGFFEPVAYRGAEARAGWSPSADAAVWATLGWRAYGATGAVTVLRPLADQGRRAEVGGRLRASASLVVEAGYDLEWGPGGFLSSADASARWGASERLTVVASATTFQQIEQYRLGDGRGVGFGVSAEAEASGRISLSGGVSLLRHTGAGGAAASAWNQSRGWSSVRVLVGDDPGQARGRAR
jgi:hypothetical protein